MFTWVYKYRYWNAERQVESISRDMFTMDAIRSGLGMAIMESGIKVRDDQVDSNGRLKRDPMSATGGT
ncbi:MAG: hypothetical protein H7Y14_01610 [Burkholderiales bacterium]|nr:hypothetical protein [Burkholderiales bacterium]